MSQDFTPTICRFCGASGRDHKFIADIRGHVVHCAYLAVCNDCLQKLLRQEKSLLPAAIQNAIQSLATVVAEAAFPGERCSSMQTKRIRLSAALVTLLDYGIRTLAKGRGQRDDDIGECFIQFAQIWADQQRTIGDQCAQMLRNFQSHPPGCSASQVSEA